MKNLLLYVAISLLTACTPSPKVSQGEKPGTDAIVIARVNTLPVNSPVYIKVAQDAMFGPTGGFKVSNGNPLAVTTLAPGRYKWVEILNVRYAGAVDVSGILPPFEAKSGCITYIGDIRMDFNGPKARVAIDQPNKSTLSEFKDRYKKLFEANAVCK